MLQIYGVTATPTRLFRVTERLIIAWMVKNFMHYVGPEHSLQKQPEKLNRKIIWNALVQMAKLYSNRFWKRNLSYREN
jgi:hypothetical protein